MNRPPAKDPAAATPRLELNGGGDADPADMLTVAAVGDVLLHKHVQRWASQQPDGYAGMFRGVRDIIRAADIAFANLEGPTAQGVLANGRNTEPSPMLFDNAIFTGYPRFNYHPSLCGDVKDAGFSVVNTANNHSLDRLQLGADRTIEALKETGLAFTGSRHRDGRSAPWHVVTPVRWAGRSYNIAWLGCTYGTNGRPDRARQILNCYVHREEIRGIVRDLAGRGDIHAVLLTPHWGIEYHHKPELRQIRWAREMVEAGATAIIGQHPHVMQPLAKLTRPDGCEVPIAYSLGNFVSGQVGIARKSTAILLLGLTPGADGKLIAARIGWIPLWMQTRNGYYVEPTEGNKSPDARQHQIHLSKILCDGNRISPSLPLWGDPADPASSASDPAARPGAAPRSPRRIGTRAFLKIIPKASGG